MGPKKGRGMGKGFGRGRGQGRGRLHQMRGIFPGKSVMENRTKKAVVDIPKCLSCGACIEVCPQGAIKLEDKAVINERKCIGCGYCMARCPAEAISLVDK
jgi:ferredoxin